MLIETIVFAIIVLVVSALPLYFVVKILGGRASLIGVIFINLIAALLIPIIKSIFGTIGGIVAFILLIWVYREMFRLKWWKAFVAWFLQIVVAWILAIILIALGLSVIVIGLM